MVFFSGLATPPSEWETTLHQMAQGKNIGRFAIKGPVRFIVAGNPPENKELTSNPQIPGGQTTQPKPGFFDVPLKSHLHFLSPEDFPEKPQQQRLEMPQQRLEMPPRPDLGMTRQAVLSCPSSPKTQANRSSCVMRPPVTGFGTLDTILHTPVI